VCVVFYLYGSRVGVLFFIVISLVLLLDWVCYGICKLVEMWTLNSRLIPCYQLLHYYFIETLSICVLM
jgi:hypothetical protein